MIGYLRGKILQAAETSGKVTVVISTGEAGFGVGYAVSVPGSAAYEALIPGQVIEFFVHTHVREDLLDLYGFFTREEKEMFLTLLTVNGIGPKGALSILSKAELTTLVQAIASEDKDLLSSLPGIGKKTAERVIVELAKPMQKKLEQGLYGKAESSVRKVPVHSPLIGDAMEALVGLGYREAEVHPILKKLVADHSDENLPPLRTPQDLVKSALRYLSHLGGSKASYPRRSLERDLE